MARQDTRQAVTPQPPVAARIQQAQSEQNKTNGEVAEALGVSVRLYQKWKAGKVTPSYPNLVRLADFYGHPVSWFFSEKEAA